VITSIAVEQNLQTSRQSLELRARVRLHPLAIGTLGLGVGGQLLAEVGVEPHAWRHRRGDVTNRFERGHGQQEVRVRRGGGVGRPMKVDAPPGRVALVEAELVDGPVE
jgi:hypothetical protein